MDRRDFVLTSTLGVAGVGLVPRWAAAQEAAVEVPRHYLHCYTHRLDMERGFKFHCLVPAHGEGVYGRHEYAGFFTVRVGEEPWVFVGDTPPVHDRTPERLADLNRAQFSLRRLTPAWRIDQFVDWNALGPATWLSARVEAQAAAPIIGALMGWGWAERRTGDRWFADAEPLARAPGRVLELPPGCLWAGYHDVTEAFSGVLAFSAPPAEAWVDDDGVYWDWGPAPAGRATYAPAAAYILAPGLLSPDKMARLAELLATPPTEFVAGVRTPETSAWTAVAEEAQAAPLPPSLRRLSPYTEGVLPLATAAGEMLIIPRPRLSVDLPAAPEIEAPLPKLAGPEAVVAELSRHVAGLLEHRETDGRFTFSQGRTFYDGITCGVLGQTLPVLPDEARRATGEAVRACLDALCDQHVRSPAYNLLVPPEMPSFIETGIDYPEITATLLHAVLAYTLNADPAYAARRVDLIETHLDQIREMTTPEGLAWARADTQHMHLIAESAIGGYVAWGALYHLGKLLGKPWASECRSRAALNWAAYRGLFAWRSDDFGDIGVVNGWSNWCAELGRPEPWAYVQSTWFSYVPWMTYGARDEFHLWKNLREQPWWGYTRTEESSRQRCYDYANMLALAKAGLWEREVAPHFEAVAGRPFWFDYFDATPVMAVGALPQLAAMGLIG